MAGLNFGNRYTLRSLNKDLRKQYQIKGTAGHFGRRMIIIQYDQNGKEINSFKGIDQASEKLGIDYSRAKYLIQLNNKNSVEELRGKDGIYLKRKQDALF